MLPMMGSASFSNFVLAFVILSSANICVLCFDVNPQQEVYLPDYKHYHNLTHIAAHLHQTLAKYSDFMYINYDYTSRNQEPMLVTRITDFSYPAGSVENQNLLEKQGTDSSKVKILLSYGEHAREFFPIESYFHLLNNLTQGLSAEKGSYAHSFSQMVLKNFDILAVVIANPDGRKHVEISLNYCWRGTSTGVDLNRNFDWHFGKKGSSADPKDEEYRGPSPFSEPECDAYRRLTQSEKFDAFISFHSGIRHIYMPFADTVSKEMRRNPPNFKSLSELSARLANSTKYKFHYGIAYNLNFYTADGTAFDYMAAVKNVPFSLAIEMWHNKNHKGPSCFDEFNPDSQHLQEELEAFHPMYVELFTYLLQWKQEQQKSSWMTMGYILLCAVIAACLVYLCKSRRCLFFRRMNTVFMAGKLYK